MGDGTPVWDLQVVAGGRFSELFTYYSDPAGTQPVDLTDYHARLMVREEVDDAEPIISITDVDSADGVITLGGAAGTVQVVFEAVATARLTSSGLYDLFLDSPAAVGQPFITGQVKVRKAIVR